MLNRSAMLWQHSATRANDTMGGFGQVIEIYFITQDTMAEPAGFLIDRIGLLKNRAKGAIEFHCDPDN